MSPPQSRISKRVVVAFPKVDDHSVWAEVLAARNLYDPLTSKIAAHLTLVAPFEDTLSDQALYEHVRAAVSGICRFTVTLGQVTVHDDEYLFLNVKRGNDQIVYLRDALYSGVLAAHLVRTHTFVPHVTVGRVAIGDLPSALDRTSLLTTPVRANVHSVSVYGIELDGRRPILFEVPLSSVDAD